MRQQLDLILAAEAEGLIRDYQALGGAALIDAGRVAARRDRLLLVLVQTSDGEVLAGRMSGVPARLQGYATSTVDPQLRMPGAVLPGNINMVVGARTAAVAHPLAWRWPRLIDRRWSHSTCRPEHGVVIAGVSQDSPAERAGLQPGDVLKAVGSHTVDTPQQAVTALRQAGKAEDAVALRVMRDGQTSFVALQATPKHDQG